MGRYKKISSKMIHYVHKVKTRIKVARKTNKQKILTKIIHKT